MPTCAGAMRFSREQRQAIGNWVEQPEAEDKSFNDKATFPMHLHYNDDKTLMAGHVKGLAVTCLYKFLGIDEETNQITVQKSHVSQELDHLRALMTESAPDGTPLVDYIGKIWHSSEWQAGTDESGPSQIPAAAVLRPAFVETIRSTKPPEEDVQQVASPTRNIQDILSPQLPLDDGSCSDGSEQLTEHDMEFIIQDSQGKRAKVHFVSVYDTGWPVPFCRTSCGRFNKWPKHTGWKPSDLPTGEILVKCPGCFKQLPSDASDDWSDYLGD